MQKVHYRNWAFGSRCWNVQIVGIDWRIKMDGNPGEEAKIRDFLANEMHHFPQLVTNLGATKAALAKAQADFSAITADQGGPTPCDLLRCILSKRNLVGLNSFHDLELIDTEFKLLDTGKGGFQPSADILARCIEDTRLFLFEVKRHVLTERQAVTELSAYSFGLNARIWNMTSADYAWVPICTDWRTTVHAAFANEAIWSMRPVLPMRCTVKKDANDAIVGVDLEILSLLDDVDEPLALSQFAWDCFDTWTFQLKKEPSDPRTVLEFISAIAARHGFSGCVLYGKSMAGDAFMYPYVYALTIHNPYKAALKRRQLEIVRDHRERGGVKVMRKKVKDPLFSWHDIDFRTMDDRDSPEVCRHIAQNAAEKGDRKTAKEYLAKAKEAYLSVGEMAMSAGNRAHQVISEITARLRLFCDFDLGAPSLKGLLEEKIPVLFDEVSYFGMMQEAAYERLHWEVGHAEGGDGPIIGDYGGDPLYAIGSPHFFFEFMSLMNFEHETQTDYYDDEDEEAEDAGE